MTSRESMRRARHRFDRLQRTGIVTFAPVVTLAQVRKALNGFCRPLASSHLFILTRVPVAEVRPFCATTGPHSFSLGPLIIDHSGPIKRLHSSYRVKGDHVLLDGHHRLRDAKRGRRKYLPAYVGILCYDLICSST